MTISAVNFKRMRYLLALSLFAISLSLHATVWEVGSGKTYTKPSAVMNLVVDGDTVLIDAGVYPMDVGTWKKDNLLIRGVGGRAHMKSGGMAAAGKAIWVIQGDNTVIENIEFSECAVVDKNGAGIRQEGKNLTVRNCYFHHNENGILAGDNPDSEILIEFCEFFYNGHGDGLSHNMYINHIKKFTIRFSYTHHAFIGHNIKTRAYENHILYNRIMDEDTGQASMLVDVPNGGRTFIIGNVLMQGPSAQNKRMIAYGAEGLSNPVNELFVNHNTMVNKRHTGTFVFIQTGTDSALVANNIFAGIGDSVIGSCSYMTNVRVADGSISSTFASPSTFDFKPVGGPDYTSIINNATGFFSGIYDIHPYYEYSHVADSTNRFLDTDQDVGAFEVSYSGIIEESTNKASVILYPIPAQQNIYYKIIDEQIYRNNSLQVLIIDLEGKILYQQKLELDGLIGLSEFAPGLYYFCLQVPEGDQIYSTPFIKY